jgi:hypothetical protein
LLGFLALRRDKVHAAEGTSKVNGIGTYPKVKYRAQAAGSVSSAGVLLLTETARVIGLVEALETELGGFARPRAVHHPGKAVADLAVMLAAGGVCPADVVMLRARPHLFGPVASDPTISRIIDDLADDVDVTVDRIAAARASVRAMVGRLPGGALPEPGGHVVVDIDATLVTSHSEKELAAPTFKRGFGFHPMLAFADHGEGGTGAPLGAVLRPGNAGSNTAADHIAVLDLALAQLDPRQQARVLVRTDSAGGTKAFTQHIADAELAYSVGFAGFLPHLKAALDTIPESAWIPAVNGDGNDRDGAWVTEITAVLDLAAYPAGMRVIARKERPHPGAQLTLTDVDGHRVTCFATNDTSTDLPAMESRHRQRARCEDRIRDAKNTGLDRFPYADAASNAIWLQIVLLALDLTTWAQALALTGTWRLARPKTLRVKLFATAARYVTAARRRIVDLDPDWPWTNILHEALQQLAWLAKLAPP